MGAIDDKLTFTVEEGKPVSYTRREVRSLRCRASQTAVCRAKFQGAAVCTRARQRQGLWQWKLLCTCIGGEAVCMRISPYSTTLMTASVSCS